MKNKQVITIVAVSIIGISVVLFLFIKQKESQTGHTVTDSFVSNTVGLATAKSQETVSLQNGDTYLLSAEIVKKAINGREVKMLAYNGSIPGPLFKVPQGAEITLKFTNNTYVDTTVHSHGVRVDNKFDGVPDVTQDPVKPGQSFTYKLKFPDVGVYWYHPHIREDYAQELGLYGNFIVTPENSDYWAEVDREEALFLDDILVENGQIASFDETTIDHTLMGRFGNAVLVNGDENYSLSVKQGERVRFYITNSANTRVFNFAIPDMRMKLVGGDNGKYEREEWVDGVIISPSERAVIEIWFDQDGTYEIQNQTPDKTYALGSINVEEVVVTTSYFLVARENKDFIESINTLRPLFTKPADKSLNITVDLLGNMMSSMGGHMMPDGTMMGGAVMGTPEKIEWEDDMEAMNKESTTNTVKWKLVDQETKYENLDIDWQFNKGDMIKIKIFNDDKSMHPMQHPIHIHGQRFLVLSTNNTQTNNFVWKDTALIQTGDTVELLVQMDNPGDWVIHCHIPEHMEAGMMSQFEVI